MRGRDVGEAAVAVVVKQEVPSVSGDEQIQAAVVVVVDHARTVAAEIRGAAAGIHAELLGDVDEA